MQQTQNAVLAIKADYDEPDHTPAVPSVFGNLPAATADEVGMITTTLAACFPQMPSLFWGLVAKQACAQCVSKARLEFIAERLMLTHKYPTLTMADIFGIDKSIHIIDYEEYNRLQVPHRPLARIQFDGRWHTVYRDDAERYGYAYEPVESEAERLVREDQERQARWQREYDALPEQEKERLRRLAEKREALKQEQQ